MNEKLTRDAIKWGVAAAILGTATDAAYLGGAVIDVFPRNVSVGLFFAFGPLLALASYSIGRWLAALDKDSLFAQLGVLMNIVAGAVFSVVSILQLALPAFVRERLATGEGADAPLLREVLWGTNNIQMALDLVFDIWISAGTVLLGLALLTRLALRPVIGGLGVIIGSAGLLINFSHFPIPPAEAGGIDPGPAFGAWYGLVTLIIVYHLIRGRA